MKNIISNIVIVVLLVMNVCVICMIMYSMKPKCILDGCRHARSEQGFYCAAHMEFDAGELYASK